MLFPRSGWMFLLFNVVSRVGVTDPDVDVSSL